MTKNDLARELAVSEGLHLSTATKAVDGLIKIVKNSLAKGEDIRIRGFGTIAVVRLNARKAIDFRTKEPITLAARNIVKIRPYNELKKLLNHRDYGTMD